MLHRRLLLQLLGGVVLFVGCDGGTSTVPVRSLSPGTDLPSLDEGERDYRNPTRASGGKPSTGGTEGIGGAAATGGSTTGGTPMAAGGNYETMGGMGGAVLGGAAGAAP